MNELLDTIVDRGPRSFSRKELSSAADLFTQRLALLYTPTKNIPDQHVGAGPLKIVLPLPCPSVFDLLLRSGYERPKLWLDTIQRATGKIRWRSIRAARVTITRFDTHDQSPGNRSGVKGLIDALKARSGGRKDRVALFYFGALFDDCPGEMELSGEPQFRRVRQPKDAHVEIEINPA